MGSLTSKVLLAMWRSRVCIESLQLCHKKLYYEGFAILFSKIVIMEGL